MNKTKQNILSTAKKLFNHNGFSHVTIRMIAEGLEMSSGNLNYHYKKREDILEALYFEMVEVFDERVKQIEQKEITLKTIRKDVLTSMYRMVDYTFFWTDLYNILRLNRNIKHHFKKVYQKRFNGYEFLFSYLIEKGLMKEFEGVKEREFLIERLIGFSNTWLYNSNLYEQDIDDQYIELQCDNLMMMFYPYLTATGKTEYNNITGVL